MRAFIKKNLLIAVSAVLLAGASVPFVQAFAPPKATPPSGATAICRDGTYSYSKHRRGTCSHHGGVRKWLKKVPN